MARRTVAERAALSRKVAELASLQARNVHSSRRVTGLADAVVSLTSYGPRLRTVHLTIESIGLGTTLPRRLILWLAKDDLARPLPRPLRRLQERGLEIIGTEDYKSHKKIFPYAVSERTDRSPCATADDDVLYPRSWLAGLCEAHALAPRSVNGYRARRMLVRGDTLAPYSEWPKCTDSDVRVDTFLTGVSGIIYPASVLDSFREAGEAFRDICPTSDDVWLHHVALRSGVAAKQLSANCVEFPGIPRTQGVALMRGNVDGGANDKQIAQVYDAEDIQAIRTAVPRSIGG
jgi:hypothetical protein